MKIQNVSRMIIMVRVSMRQKLGLSKLNDDKFTVSIIRPSLVYGKGVKANMQSIVNLIRFCPLLPFRKYQ